MALEVLVEGIDKVSQSMSLEGQQCSFLWGFVDEERRAKHQPWRSSNKPVHLVYEDKSNGDFYLIKTYSLNMVKDGRVPWYIKDDTHKAFGIDPYSRMFYKKFIRTLIEARLDDKISEEEFISIINKVYEIRDARKNLSRYLKDKKELTGLDKHELMILNFLRITTYSCGYVQCQI